MICTAIFCLVSTAPAKWRVELRAKIGQYRNRCFIIIRSIQTVTHRSNPLLNTYIYKEILLIPMYLHKWYFKFFHRRCSSDKWLMTAVQCMFQSQMIMRLWAKIQVYRFQDVFISTTHIAVLDERQTTRLRIYRIIYHYNRLYNTRRAGKYPEEFGAEEREVL